MRRVGTALVGFGVLTGLVLFPFTHRWDQVVAAYLQRIVMPYDLPVPVLVLLGNVDVAIPLAALAATLLLLVTRRAIQRAAWLVFGLAAGTAIELVFKAVIPHPAPGGLSGHLVILLGLTMPAPYGFPSGHTLRVTMIACTALRRIPWLAGALVLSVMVGLVCSGSHWPSEVLGGLCLGWALFEMGALIRQA
jgi:membrane-associated phospholipid phosphatase